MILDIKKHAIDKARERISVLGHFSKEYVEGWLRKNVPSSKKIMLGSELYDRLEKIYNPREYRPLAYSNNDLGIYIVELSGKDRGILLSVQDLNFRKRMKVSLAERRENFSKLMGLRESLSV